MRTAGIWISGVVACGIAGALLSVALTDPIAEVAFLALTFGFVGGAAAFVCARLWMQAR